eukprot:NODE_572_length_5896_cov_0.685872.p5 type:complete len:153 gc:universal NODE_572_length_5896_cov_0.685872:5288-4830(-)
MLHHYNTNSNDINPCVLGYLVYSKYRYLRDVIRQLEKMDSKSLLLKILKKSEYDLISKSQIIYFRMRLAGNLFPQIVYKIIAQKKNVISLNSKVASALSSKHNDWRILRLDSILKRKSSHRALATKFIPLELESSFDYDLVELDITMDDLLN